MTRRVKIANIRGPEGLSAYEIALKNGFVGSEIEWLDSIQIGSGSGDGYALRQHIEDEEPHPAYDRDMPNLLVLFNNKLA